MALEGAWLRDLVSQVVAMPVGQAVLAAAAMAQGQRLSSRMAGSWIAAAARGAAAGVCAAGAEANAVPGQGRPVEQLQAALLMVGEFSVQKALERLRGRGHTKLASRLQRLSKARNAISHPDTELLRDVAAAVAAWVSDDVQEENGESDAKGNQGVDFERCAEVEPHPACGRGAEDTGGGAGGHCTARDESDSLVPDGQARADVEDKGEVPLPKLPAWPFDGVAASAAGARCTTAGVGSSAGNHTGRLGVNGEASMYRSAGSPQQQPQQPPAAAGAVDSGCDDIACRDPKCFKGRTDSHSSHGDRDVVHEGRHEDQGCEDSGEREVQHGREETERRLAAESATLPQQLDAAEQEAEARRQPGRGLVKKKKKKKKKGEDAHSSHGVREEVHEGHHEDQGASSNGDRVEAHEGRHEGHGCDSSANRDHYSHSGHGDRDEAHEGRHEGQGWDASANGLTDSHSSHGVGCASACEKGIVVSGDGKGGPRNGTQTGKNVGKMCSKEDQQGAVLAARLHQAQLKADQARLRVKDLRKEELHLAALRREQERALFGSSV